MANRRYWKGIRILLVASVSLGLLGWVIASMRVTTRQGVNFQVSTRGVPLYVKAIDFLSRHHHYQVLAEEITKGLHSDRERLVAIFDWTRQHIRETPAGWPVVDDHILHIIIRGYGLADQMADVFTTLSTYAGIPAFWQTVRLMEGDRRGYACFSFAHIDGRWAMFDVRYGLMVTDPSGRFIDVHDVLREPGLIETISGALAPGEIPYRRYVEQLRPFHVPAVLRAREQMPWPRVWTEMHRTAHRLIQVIDSWPTGETLAAR